jgi:hypothetical protein
MENWRNGDGQKSSRMMDSRSDRYREWGHSSLNFCTRGYPSVADVWYLAEHIDMDLLRVWQRQLPQHCPGHGDENRPKKPESWHAATMSWLFLEPRHSRSEAIDQNMPAQTHAERTAFAHNKYLYAENGRHSDTVRTGWAVIQQKEIAKIL